MGDVDMEKWRWRHEKIEAWKKWRHRHETWKHCEIETWRHGHGDIAMKTGTWRHIHGDMDMETWAGGMDIRRQ
jgi:hypothetical protein